MTKSEMIIQHIIEIEGPEYSDRQWLHTPFDTFVENPFYDGPEHPHPELLPLSSELSITREDFIGIPILIPTTIEEALADITVSYDDEYDEYEGLTNTQLAL